MSGKLRSARHAEAMVARLTEAAALTEHAPIFVPGRSASKPESIELATRAEEARRLAPAHDLTESWTGRTPAKGEGRGQWMPTDLGVTVEDRPGGLADIGEALGNAGINIEGLCGMGLGDRGVIHLLVEDGAAARAALEGAGLTVESESEAIVSEIPGDVNTPGTLGKMARAVAEAGVNMRAVYLATNNRAVAVTDDNAKALAALGM
jgi:hypothetical protein